MDIVRTYVVVCFQTTMACNSLAVIINNLHYKIQLLQNLEYSEAVQVHIVNNGQEVMPYSEWNLEKILG